MCLKKCKGLLRASLCLAVGYLDKTCTSVGSFDRCSKIVANYLQENGLNFDYSLVANKMLVKIIVETAEKVNSYEMTLEEGITLLDKRLNPSK